MPGIRVLIADHGPAVRDGLRSILRTQPDIHVLGEAQDGLAAVARCEELQPDVVLIDAQLPGIDGAEATRRLKDLVPNTRVLFMTTYAASIHAGLAAGADEYWIKDTGTRELMRAIRSLGARA